MRESEHNTDWFRWRQLVWLSVLVCDWVIVCQESLFMLARPSVCVCVCRCGCVCVWVHVEVRLWCVNLPVPWAISPQPPSNIILIDPHLFRTAPNPDNLSSNFSSLSNPSLSHSVTYWAGLKLPPLSLSYTIITRLTTWNMNTPMSPRQPRKPHVISLDLGDTAASHCRQRLGLSVRWGGYCERYFNTLCCESDL